MMMKASAVAVPIQAASNKSDSGLRDQKKCSDSVCDDSEDKISFQLDDLVAKEVSEWRAEVSGSQSELRHRKKSLSSVTETSLDEVCPSLPQNVTNLN